MTSSEAVSSAAVEGAATSSATEDAGESSPANTVGYPSPLRPEEARGPAPEESTAEESGPAYYTAAEIGRLAPKTVNWVAKPWIAHGALTVLDGKPKTAGKTTFLAHLIKKVLDGEKFLDEPTMRSKVVLLTEERPTTFRRVLERTGLLDRDDLHVLFRDEVHDQGWEPVAASARERCATLGAKLLIVDTLGAFAPGFERSSAATRSALDPLYQAARAGLAVLAVRHERKSGGAAGESGMGSTAMTAAVDVIMALQRPKNYSGPGRMLLARSRFEETPEELAIQLHDGEFVRMASLDLSAEQIERTLLAAAPTNPEDAKSADELQLLTSLKKTSARTALEHLCARCRLIRVGSGTRGNAYRYYKRPLEVVA